jgi:hypothetical protein
VAVQEFLVGRSWRGIVVKSGTLDVRWTSPRIVDTQLRVYNHPGRSNNGENTTHLHP